MTLAAEIKKMLKFASQPEDSQAGVSLMLAVLILSAITAVAFSLATIVFIEIRSSSDTIRTEPTLYAAFGLTEEALFQYKRFIDDPVNYDITNCPNLPNEVCEFNGVNLELPGDQPIAFDDNPRVEHLEAGEIKTIPMYTQGCFEQLYDAVSLQVLPGGSNLNFYFKITAADDSGVQIYPQVPLVATTATAREFSGFSAFRGQWELILDNTDGDELNVSIIADRSAVPPECDDITSSGSGLPFVGEQVLRIRALFQGLSRTYQVRIPIP